MRHRYGADGGARILLIGLFGITPDVLPAYVSTHVLAERVGEATAVRTRGGTVGILLARTVSGGIGTRFGRRELYGFAAIALVPVLLHL